MHNKETLAYAAGLFDGEGCVDIYKATKAKASKNPSLLLRVTIVQKDGRVMNWLQDNFGGYAGKDTHGGHYIHRWDLRSQQAASFLRLILPYMQIKKEQAELAISFAEMKAKYLESLKGHRGFRPLTPEEVEQGMDIKLRLSAMKRDYKPYRKNSAPTTTKRKDLS